MNKYCILCKKKTNHIKKFEYYNKPRIETAYNLFTNKKYHRFYSSCAVCSHWISNFRFDTSKFYSGIYNQKSYEDHQATFNNIINLKKNKSDNYHRCKRIKNFVKKKHFKNCNILDVGSGLGVFPYSMNKVGIRCDAVDPDITMVKHMKKNLKNFSNKIFYANFLKFKNKKKYNIITLNKVLEHVENPYKFLSKTKKFLKTDGYLYIELPDIEKAKKISKNREEFTIEHIHGFTLRSFDKLVKNLKMNLEIFERIKEPSGKYTFYCFVNNF